MTTLNALRKKLQLTDNLAAKAASLWAVSALTLALAAGASTSHEGASDGTKVLRWVQVQAKTKQDRTRIYEMGVTIEAIRSGSIWGFADAKALARLKAGKERILGDFPAEVGRGGHDEGFGTFRDFPTKDERFHNYAETVAALNAIHEKHGDITALQKIGSSLEGRDILAININTSQGDLRRGRSDKPGVIFMGNHHAREHVSNEIPLMLAEYLTEHRQDPTIAALLDSRDIWIIPMVNPDGVEFDISTSSYKMWRKNRRKNDNGTWGVDLNRNYSFGWGTGPNSPGNASHDPGSDTYMGTAPFSEPETQNIRDFVEDHLNAKVLLTFHTFSELILYPWGGKDTPIEKSEDLAVFEKMAKTMAQWNGYKPEQASDLYIAAGDTTDWAYGEHGIFAFTFELSPSRWAGPFGFYPGAKVLDKVFDANLKPCLYLMEVADNPYKVVNSRESDGLLRNLAQPVEALGNQWWQPRPY
jgi:carboxypeptidase T